MADEIPTTGPADKSSVPGGQFASSALPPEEARIIEEIVIKPAPAKQVAPLPQTLEMLPPTPPPHTPEELKKEGDTMDHRVPFFSVPACLAIQVGARMTVAARRGSSRRRPGRAG